ncbi:MAG: (2Fe-2S)-binding protein [Deltaproteobacteria bacterium]|nr:(2Fe-2S)-binding protein [Deltaproteobacteria bacterium]
MALLEIKVNGMECQVAVDATTSLLTVLREHLHITGPKVGCETGDCGACSVLVNGTLRRACLTHALSVQGADIETIEGAGGSGGLHPLQKAFYEKHASQCGFCTPGMIMTAKALLDENPNPTVTDIKETLSGNLCRCGSYINIIEAVKFAAELVADEGGDR